MSLQYTLVGTEDGDQVVSVFVPGEAAQVALSDHPNFDAILDGARSGDESVMSLFDLSETVAQSFENLSERVSVANGRVYFDGDEVANSLTKQIIRFLDEGAGFKPLVRFLEKLMQNPLEHSRENLYRWLDAADFTISPTGDIVGYKGVSKSGDQYVSVHSGQAIVDGSVVKGQIPQAFGSIIEMPRSGVNHDPATGCSTGLHVGTWEYANSFGNGGVLEVRVNPRDVVSVPTDSGDAKLRCCRYEVVKLLSEPYASAYVDDGGPEDEYDYWGEYEDEPIGY